MSSSHMPVHHSVCSGGCSASAPDIWAVSYHGDGHSWKKSVQKQDFFFCNMVVVVMFFFNKVDVDYKLK